MKIIKYMFLAVVLAGVLFTSCTNDDALNEIEAIEQQANTGKDLDDTPTPDDE